MTAALLAAASRAICSSRRVIATNGCNIHALPRYASPWPGRWMRVGEAITQTEAQRILEDISK